MRPEQRVSHPFRRGRAVYAFRVYLLSLEHRVRSMFALREFVAAGGLMTVDALGRLFNRRYSARAPRRAAR
jgi:hypothetical protein